ncbi:MAG: trypsin-like peptidase domain-containing protein [Dehalococcoidales bacterium]|nr:trypsin-like peptidase domain-containing protein [Dehalococcoidales bacterium]
MTTKIKIVLIVVAVVLLAGVITNGYLNWQDNKRFEQTQADFAALRSDIAQLTANLNTLEGDISQVAANLEDNVSQITSSLAALEGDIFGVANDLKAHDNALIAAIPKIEPSVVRVDVSDAGFIRSGSGIIVSNTGYVITTQQVVDVGAPIQITLMNGDKYYALVVNSNRSRDLAILKMNTSRTDLPVAALGSSNSVKVGEEIIAAGFPLGIQFPGQATFTRGIISGVRAINGQNYIQADASLNPGSSGSCLADLDGKIIGITTTNVISSSLQTEGLGFAIPVDEVKTFIQSSIGQ